MLFGMRSLTTCSEIPAVQHQHNAAIGKLLRLLLKVLRTADMDPVGMLVNVLERLRLREATLRDARTIFRSFKGNS